MTLPSLLAYAGIPYQVFGVRSRAVSLTIAWIRSPRARSPGDIAASAESTASSPSAAAFSSLARAFIAAFSSAVNLSDFLSFLVVLLLVVVLIVLLSFVGRPARSGRAAVATC